MINLVSDLRVILVFFLKRQFNQAEAPPPFTAETRVQAPLQGKPSPFFGISKENSPWVAPKGIELPTFAPQWVQTLHLSPVGLDFIRPGNLRHEYTRLWETRHDTNTSYKWRENLFFFVYSFRVNFELNTCKWHEYTNCQVYFGPNQPNPTKKINGLGL